MDAIRLGILYSTSGPYGAIGRDCRDGVAMAVEDLKAEGRLPLPLDVTYGDPGGVPGQYLDLAKQMLRDRGCRHIIGTIISQARKDVTPLIEKYDGLLWYICPYEGFEANENILYLSACPNQHLLPVLDYLMPRFGSRVYLTGSNYVWGWEMNRLARELVTRAGGEIVGDRYLPLDETDVDRLIAEVAERRPSFILNNLVGPASYAFMAGVHGLAKGDAAFSPDRCPVVSCDLTECELSEVAPGAAAGQLAAACYFDSVDTAENAAFKQRVAARYGAGRKVSSYFAEAYTAVRLCAETIAAEGSDDPAVVRRALYDRPMPTVIGPVTIDRLTNHASLPFHLGRITADNGFEILASRPPIVADPYLVGTAPDQRLPYLRVVR